MYRERDAYIYIYIYIYLIHYKYTNINKHVCLNQKRNNTTIAANGKHDRKANVTIPQRQQRSRQHA